MKELRGTVEKVVFSVRYPDGSTKESTYTPTSKLKGVLFTEDMMTNEMLDKFNVSRDNWKENPAMIIVDGDLSIPNCDYPRCQNA